MQNDQTAAAVKAENLLPPGTYPARDAPPAAPAPPDGTAPMYEEKPRRVGVLTMAVALIAVGVLMVVRVFGAELDYAFILRLSPVVLILLGTELLAAMVLSRGKPIRLDVVSVVLCLVLIGCSLVGAVVPEAIYNRYVGGQTASRISAQLRQASYELAKAEDLPAVDGVDWYVDLNGHVWSRDMDYTDLGQQHYVQMRTALAGEYAGAEAFAADCLVTMQAMRTLVPDIDYLVFNTRERGGLEMGTPGYTLWLDGPWGFDLDVEAAAALVQTLYWFEPHGAWLSKGDYEQAELDWAREQAALEQAGLAADLYELDDAAADLQARITELETDMDGAGHDEAAQEELAALRAELETLDARRAALREQMETENSRTT